MTESRLFLGVENSATGRAWRNRLDERGSARALAIAQRHDLPELRSSSRLRQARPVAEFSTPRNRRLSVIGAIVERFVSKRFCYR